MKKWLLKTIIWIKINLNLWWWSAAAGGLSPLPANTWLLRYGPSLTIHFIFYYWQAPRRLAKLARVIRVIVRMNISMKKYLEEETNPNWSLLEMTLNLRNHFDKILSFRPTDKWVRTSKEAFKSLIISKFNHLGSYELIGNTLVDIYMSWKLLDSLMALFSRLLCNV